MIIAVWFCISLLEEFATNLFLRIILTKNHIPYSFFQSGSIGYLDRKYIKLIRNQYGSARKFICIRIMCLLNVLLAGMAMILYLAK